MLVSLEEIKGYLRVDYADDDTLLTSILEAAHKQCMDILRLEKDEEMFLVKNAKLAVMYAAAYMYEHREEADYNSLNLSLRAMLFGDRKAGF